MRSRSPLPPRTHAALAQDTLRRLAPRSDRKLPRWPLAVLRHRKRPGPSPTVELDPVCRPVTKHAAPAPSRIQRHADHARLAPRIGPAEMRRGWKDRLELVAPRQGTPQRACTPTVGLVPKVLHLRASATLDLDHPAVELLLAVHTLHVPVMNPFPASSSRNRHGHIIHETPLRASAPQPKPTRGQGRRRERARQLADPAREVTPPGAARRSQTSPQTTTAEASSLPGPRRSCCPLSRRGQGAGERRAPQLGHPARRLTAPGRRGIRALAAPKPKDRKSRPQPGVEVETIMGLTYNERSLTTAAVRLPP